MSLDRIEKMVDAFGERKSRRFAFGELRHLVECFRQLVVIGLEECDPKEQRRIVRDQAAAELLEIPHGEVRNELTLQFLDERDWIRRHRYLTASHRDGELAKPFHGSSEVAARS